MSVEEQEVKISKHKIRGKHSLKYDSIFKGKREEKDIQDDDCYMDLNSNQNFDIDASSDYYLERENPYEYNRRLDLSNDVKDIIDKYLSVDVLSVRRKPSKIGFNRDYRIIVEHIDNVKYSLADVFVTFALYFSENLETMFKLLDNEWKDLITKQLYKSSNNNIVKNLDNIDFQ